MMMALKSPMMPPSPNNALMSAFSPYTDSPTSPNSFISPVVANPPSEHSNFLHPPAQSSPLTSTSSASDIADPSPIAPSSTGTDTTDINDSGLENERIVPQPALQSATPELKLETVDASDDSLRPSSDEQPSSVIHAPQGFERFHARGSPPPFRRSTPTPSQRSDETTVLIEESSDSEKRSSGSLNSPPPITTTVAPVRDWSATPRAQTRPEAESEALDQERPNSQRSARLENIPEGHDAEQTDEQTPNNRNAMFDSNSGGRFQDTAEEIAALQLALSECWTLCNTLAGLSYIHRERAFSYAGKGNNQEQAWKSCWKLCQKLYDTRDEDFATHVRPTLDLCREFCQSLFEVRQREHEVADSVLRVSFELNNHLYNTSDRTLPEAFPERTLDFYITLCHRLMKQRTRLAEEPDSLLRACWSLAEMLFSLRQNKREGKPADEELLGSAVQACWELCDLFREGWTQVRPDRGTPRPSQTTFTQAFQQAKQTQLAAAVAEAEAEAEGEESEDDDFGRLNPETPTTIFEDTQQISPEDAPVPNILVLGPEHNARLQQQPRNKWSSSSSTLSEFPQGSEHTSSSTSTIINPSEDPHLSCLKLLIVKAAMNVGFQRGTSMTLASFVKSISSSSFGNAPWQMNLLERYKKLVASDPGFRNPGPPRRAAAPDVARAVQWMVGSGQYAWLKDLFRLVFGFYAEEGEIRPTVMIQS